MKVYLIQNEGNEFRLFTSEEAAKKNIDLANDEIILEGEIVAGKYIGEVTLSKIDSEDLEDEIIDLLDDEEDFTFF
jgi:hypothetical protein